MPNVQAQLQVCPNCGVEIQGAISECPECSTWLSAMPRRRKKRYVEQHTTEVVSENLNGKYNIYRLGDGTHACTCRSFLYGNGMRVTNGVPTCKHIRALADITYDLEEIRPASAVQKNIMKKIGINDAGYTSEQAFFVIKEVLTFNGLSHRAVYPLLKSSQEDISLMPTYSYGVEVEFVVPHETNMSQDQIAGILAQDVEIRYDNYTHQNMNRWKLVYDGSVSGGISCEAVSRKLAGVSGLKEFEKVLSRIDSLGGTVNKSTGFHVHIDAFGMTKKDLLRLAWLWGAAEKKFINFLVPPSRINGNYTKSFTIEHFKNMVDSTASVSSPEEVGARISSRYYSLNFASLVRHATVEFRKMSGTINRGKAIPWVVLCLKMVEFVKTRQPLEKIDWNSFEGFLQSIGINPEGIPVFRFSYEKLLERYNYFCKKDEEQESIRLRYKEEDFEPFMEWYRENKLLITPVNDSTGARIIFSPEFISRLNNFRSRRTVPLNNIQQGENADTWTIRGTNSTYRVQLIQGENGSELTCSCQGYRTHGRCYHVNTLYNVLS